MVTDGEKGAGEDGKSAAPARVLEEKKAADAWHPDVKVVRIKARPWAEEPGEEPEPRRWTRGVGWLVILLALVAFAYLRGTWGRLAAFLFDLIDVAQE